MVIAIRINQNWSSIITANYSKLGFKSMKTVGCGKSRDTKSTLLQPKNIKHLSNTSPDAGLKAIVEIYFKFHHPLQNTASATRFL